MLPRIKNIISVEYLKVKTLWNTGEIREINFNNLLSEYQSKPESIFYKLFDKQTFLAVKTDKRTLYWENLGKIQDYDGKLKLAPLDFCPDVLYENSVEII
jgi:hypothetical protein